MKANFLNEFKKFITKGNVIDLAVGVIIGTSFTAIVNSLVKDVVMPFISMFIGGLSFSDMKYVITEKTETTAETAIYYGNFIQNIFNFLIIAFVVFLIVKILIKLNVKKEAQVKPAVTPADVVLLQEIRDILKEQK